MNKKEINRISVRHDVCWLYSGAGTEVFCTRIQAYGTTVPHRYGPRHYPLGMVVWGIWYMEHQAQNKYN